jgi:hypothetical protein
MAVSGGMCTCRAKRAHLLLLLCVVADDDDDAHKITA